MIAFVYDDGGRAAAGYKGEANDCAVRAAAIVTGWEYADLYDTLNHLAKDERPRGNKRRSNARTGVWPKALGRLLATDGFVWTPTMQIGSGCTVHLDADELPGGALVVRLSRHYAAVIDGVLHDTHDCSRDGTRCVYGYWRVP
jgi:hypothetical protein